MKTKFYLSIISIFFIYSCSQIDTNDNKELQLTGSEFVVDEASTYDLFSIPLEYLERANELLNLVSEPLNIGSIHNIKPKEYNTICSEIDSSISKCNSIKVEWIKKYILKLLLNAQFAVDFEIYKIAKAEAEGAHKTYETAKATIATAAVFLGKHSNEYKNALASKKNLKNNLKAAIESKKKLKIKINSLYERLNSNEFIFNKTKALLDLENARENSITASETYENARKNSITALKAYENAKATTIAATKFSEIAATIFSKEDKLQAQTAEDAARNQFNVTSNKEEDALKTKIKAENLEENAKIQLWDIIKETEAEAKAEAREAKAEAREAKKKAREAKRKAKAAKAEAADKEEVARKKASAITEALKKDPRNEQLSKKLDKAIIALKAAIAETKKAEARLNALQIK